MGGGVCDVERAGGLGEATIFIDESGGLGFDGGLVVDFGGWVGGLRGMVGVYIVYFCFMNSFLAFWRGLRWFVWGFLVVGFLVFGGGEVWGFARDSSEDFGTLSAAGNNAPYGMWSDGTTMWVSDYGDKKIYAYTVSTKARDSAKDFDTLDAAGNDNPRGLFSDGTTMWVSDSTDDKLYAYTLSTKARDSSKDFGHAERGGGIMRRTGCGRTGRRCGCLIVVIKRFTRIV